MKLAWFKQRLIFSVLLLLLLLGSMGSRSLVAQSDERTAKVDKLFAQWDKSDSPGCALAVVNDGRIVYQRGYGMADLEQDVPITPASVFYVGSVSKQFTAFTVALLAQQGKLSLDDDVRKYIPELPNFGAPITIRHLVHHTSGLRDYYTLLDLAGRRGDEAFNNQDVLDIAVRQKELNFKPGTQFLYSNTGYGMLAVVVERVTKKKLSAFAEENIFAPLGMTESHFHDDLTRIVKRHVYAYAPKRGGGFQLDTPYVERSGAGGVFTTVEELFKWDQNFYDARVGGEALINQVQTPGVLADGKPLDYAFGLRMTTYKGQRVVEHGGSLGGYRAQITRFPDQKFSVIALCNLGTINPGRLAYQVAEIYLADRLKQEATASAPTNVAQPPPRPQPEAGRALTAAQLAEYVGEYYSEELQTTYKVVGEGDKLSVKRRNRPDSALTPTIKDTFTLGGLSFNFNRDGQKRITGFKLDAGRVRNLRFVKKHVAQSVRLRNAQQR
jgi:CubicO group peptidase (beta-lactamase class C family)